MVIITSSGGASTLLTLYLHANHFSNTIPKAKLKVKNQFINLHGENTVQAVLSTESIFKTLESKCLA